MSEKNELLIYEEKNVHDVYPFLLNKVRCSAVTNDRDRKALEEFSKQPFDLVITDFGNTYIKILLTKSKRK